MNTRKNQQFNKFTSDENLLKTDPDNMSSENNTSGHSILLLSETDESENPAESDQEENQNQDKIQNEYIVSFDSLEEMKQFMKRTVDSGFEIIDFIDQLNSVRVKILNAVDFENFISLYPEPLNYSYNYYMKTPDFPDEQSYSVGNDHYVSFGNKALQYLGLKRTGTFNGQGILVAVFGTGVDNSHSTFSGKIIEHLDFIKNNTDGRSAYDVSYSGHGTAVASIIIGQSPVSPGVAPDADARSTDVESYSGHETAVASIIIGQSPDSPGVAPEADLLSVRVLDGNGEGDAFTLAKSIIEVLNRDIIPVIWNLSMGTYGHSQILQNAIEEALANDAGVTIIASTGNDGANSVTYPARYEGVVGVTGIDAAGQHLNFANSGNEVDIAAPAIGIYAAWDDNSIISFSGTSAAAPYITGTLAALLSGEPLLSADEAMDIIFNYTNDCGAPGWDPVMGSGCLDIGNIQDRNQPGIFDAALANHYLDTDYQSSDSILVKVSVQNNGTEQLTNVNLSVVIDGRLETVEFDEISVRETVSENYFIDKEKLQELGKIKVSSVVKIHDLSETNLTNNTKDSYIIYNAQGNE